MGAPWLKYAETAAKGPWEAYQTQSDSEYRGDTSGRNVSDMEKDWVKNEGTAGTRIKEGAKSVGRAVMPYVRPVLEGGGAVAGGIVGGTSGALAGLGLGAIPGGVAGSALGYAGGAKLADLAETAVGANSRPQPSSITGQLGQSLSDLGTGATYEMGGQIAGNLIGRGAMAAGKYISKTPLQDLAGSRAKDVFEANQSLTIPESKNVREAAKLTKKLNVKLTPAQTTGKPSLAAIEQGLATADPEFAAMLNAQDTKAKQAALLKIQESIGKGKPLPATQDLQTTGSNIVERIKGALEPVKKAEREAWSKVPNYPIPSSNFDEAASSLRKTPMVADTEASVKGILDYAERMPKTTEGMQALERTINDKMYAPNADPNTKRVLGQLKQSLADDFTAMGTAADAGDIALHGGKVVYPSQIQKEIAALEQQMTSAQGQGASLVEQNRHLYSYLQQQGETIGLMQNNGVSDAMQNAKLIQRLKDVQAKGRGTDYQPPVNGTNQQIIDNLNAGIDAKKAVLADLQPAEDVATAYRAAKDVSKSRFDQFGKGTTDKILKTGNEASGLRIPDENIARQFFTPSGAMGLIKAVGKTSAKEQMKPFVIADMLKTAAPDGVNYNVQTGINYIQKNRATLEQLGLVQEARTVLKDQLPKELDRILAKSDPDATGAQFFTPQKMRDILQKYGNIIKQLYGTEALQSFRDYNQLMGMIGRKNVTARSAGSNTAEKALNVANLMIKESVGPAKKLTDGFVMAFIKGAGVGGAGGAFTGTSLPGAATLGTLNVGRQLLANADSQIAKAFVKILQDATLNPEIAVELMKTARTGKIPATLQTIIDNHLITGTAIAASGD